MTSTKYFTNIENIKNTLDEYGIAIIPNILDKTECKNMINGMWDYLEHITQKFEKGISRDDSTTWKEYKKLYPKHSMLLQNWSVGHSQFIWDLRQNEKIMDVFSTIWKVPTKDLIVSFDGASFHFPPETTKIGWYKGNSWFHTDQSFTRNNFECIQSWVTANDVNKDDATLVILESSHKYHSSFQKKFQVEDKSDWYKLQNQEQLDFFLNKGCNIVKVECPAGSLVLWDSRTIHYGKEPEKSRINPNIRCIAYICYTPRNLASKKILQKRIKAFEELRMTSHWPHKPKLFPKNPYTYGQPLPDITPIQSPKLSKIGRLLVGYD